VLFFCLKGFIDFTVDRQTEKLEQGDSLHLKATIPQLWINPHAMPAELLMV
jgi:quercetin dioxygenase-like cupin family protein